MYVIGGTKANPRDVANNIMSKLEKSVLVDKYEIAGAGFINIYLKRDFGQSILSNWLKMNKILC